MVLILSVKLKPWLERIASKVKHNVDVSLVTKVVDMVDLDSVLFVDRRWRLRFIFLCNVILQ